MMRSGAVPVRACIDSPTCATGELAGSPRSVNVTYTVGSPVQQDAVLPHVVAQNAGGMVVIRGSGLAGVTSVGFGGNAGGTPTVRNDTGDRQSPAARSRHVRGDTGTIPFTGSLVVAASPSFTEQVLAYPETPSEVAALVYDAERQALLAALRYDDPNANRVLRYTFDGSPGAHRRRLRFRECATSRSPTAATACSCSATSSSSSPTPSRSP